MGMQGDLRRPELDKLKTPDCISGTDLRRNLMRAETGAGSPALPLQGSPTSRGPLRPRTRPPSQKGNNVRRPLGCIATSSNLAQLAISRRRWQGMGTHRAYAERQQHCLAPSPRHRLGGMAYRDPWTSGRRSTLMRHQLTFVKSSLMNVRNLGAAQCGGNTGGVLASLKKSSSNVPRRLD
jgi:hypothetical protein